MARGRRKGKKARPIEPEDVLSGRTRTDLEGLFRLIHRVNPTGRDLPNDQEARLYRQKSALQSLLIQQHGDHLRVSPSDDEGVVSLDHRLGQQNACHAVLAELEADAGLNRCSTWRRP